MSGSTPAGGPSARAQRASRPTVRVGAFVNVGGRVLLVKQHRNAERTAPAYWLLPGGGVEFGETFAEALVRESGEELGLALQPVRPIAIVESISTEPDYRKHVVHVVLAAELPDADYSDTLVSTDPHVLEARFFAPHDLDGLPLRPPFAGHLRRYLTRLPDAVEYLGVIW